MWSPVHSGSFPEKSLKLADAEGRRPAGPGKGNRGEGEPQPYLCGNGMAAFGKQAGFCLKTPDAPLVSLNGTGIYHFAPEFEAAENGGI